MTSYYPYTSRANSASPTKLSVATPSPLRHAASISSNNSSAYSSNASNSNGTAPSRTSTLSSTASATQYPGSGHKRGWSEATPASVHTYTDTHTPPPTSPRPKDFWAAKEAASSPPMTPESFRAALRPLPQAPAAPGTSPRSTSSHNRSQSYDAKIALDGATSPPLKSRPHSLAISRSDSVRAPVHDRPNRHSAHVHFASSPNQLDKSELEGLQKSKTGHFRTLSKFAENNDDDDFTITSPEQEVAGLHGRRRLQRAAKDKKTGSSMSKFTTSWQATKWMDQQRQFLQAYEYLCHIGEAKEWIEDIIHKEIPPIVQLERALADGVTLAEIVQAVHPERIVKIFRHEKLQYKHVDNINVFFRFLAEVELPDLFRFELVDLYNQKNIPKVIYCIHALSWLLFRKGIVDFRIGNLVGQLQFEDHELEEMQKGLDRAGVSVPNFSGMRADFGVPEPEPEPEPVESEEDRIERELAESEAAVEDFQAQIRGAMVRIKLGDTMQDLWDAEEALMDLQSRIRGDFARQISSYRLNMRQFATRLQSAARAFVVRSRHQSRQQHWKDREEQVVLLQSLVRARKARAEAQYMRSKIQRHDHGIRNFQAAIRGALARWDVGDQYHAAREAEDCVSWLQAAIRGALVRGQVEQQLEDTREAELHIPTLQAAIRGMLHRQAHKDEAQLLQRQSKSVTTLQSALQGFIQRRKLTHLHGSLDVSSPAWLKLQSVARGGRIRAGLRALRREVRDQTPSVLCLQSAIRASKTRADFTSTKQRLSAERDAITTLQSSARGFMRRRRHGADKQALHAQHRTITDLQAFSRAYIQRGKTFDLLCAMNEQEDKIIELQSLARALLSRGNIGLILGDLEEVEESIVALQTAIRGKLIRHQFAEKQKFYRQNMEKVIKVQSFVRARQQGQAYKSLTTGANPPVGTVKNFVHLLNDSDFDFDEEIEFEQLRKTVIQRVRQNEMAEQYVDQLDIKIALLVKNKITLDEVVKHQKHYGGHIGSLLNNKEIASKDPFDLKALNKNSRKKLEHYQELFFALQTQPQYLARLLRRFKEQGMPEQECKRIELLMMGLFGFAQKRREEYYLLKLVTRSIKEEADHCASLQDYLRSNFFWQRLLAAYLRSPRDRKYFRDLFGPLVRESIFENKDLDLESDPRLIYRALISNEELMTGQQSRRNPDIPREEAIRDPETRNAFVAHLQDLRDICDHYFILLEETLPRMPYGIRFIAQQTYMILCGRFPEEDQRHLLQVVGHWLWKTYLLPALTQPEMWGVIDRGLNPMHRKNLGEVGKVLSQVYAGRLFGGEHLYLQPLNTWVGEAIEHMDDLLCNIIDVRDSEHHFDTDELSDMFARQKPTLYIKMSDIFSIHTLIASELPALCPTADDNLREVIRELGSAKSNESEMMGVGSTEISLQLTPKFHEQADPDAELKSLFMETKRLILYIIRIQSGANLLEILVRPITAEDDDKWLALVDEELVTQNRHPRSPSMSPYETQAHPQHQSSLLDITTLSYAEVKSAALENILALESAGRLSRSNHYQDLLNAIALDIRTKHRRRVQRGREIDGVRATLAHLDDKAAYLDEQLQSYNDYIEQAMITLQTQRTKGKKKFLLPFTRQYFHERELERSGRKPKFGSFKYSASKLAEKGVLVQWDGYPPDTWGRINVTISSDEVGVFHIEGSAGSLMIPGASASVPLDDLLQAQFDGHQFMNLFKSGGGAGAGVGAGEGGGEGMMRLNVNLFLHLIFKKFYQE